MNAPFFTIPLASHDLHTSLLPCNSVTDTPYLTLTLIITLVNVLQVSFSGNNVTITPSHDLYIATYGMQYKCTTGAPTHVLPCDPNPIIHIKST